METNNQLPQTPQLHHFRSTTMADVDSYLLSLWEQCLDIKIELPAIDIRTYTLSGDTDSILSFEPPLSLTPGPSTASIQPPHPPLTHSRAIDCINSTSSSSSLTHSRAIDCINSASPSSSLTHSRAIDCINSASPSSSLTHSRAIDCVNSASPSSSLTHSRTIDCVNSASPSSSLTHSRAIDCINSASPSSSLTHSRAIDCVNSAGTHPPLSLTPGPSTASIQPPHPPLSLTPSTSRGTISMLSPKKLLLSSKVHYKLHDSSYSRTKHDVMRKEVKVQKDRGNTFHSIYQQYHTASIALQKELLNKFKRNKQQLEDHGVNQSDTKSLIHKNNVIKKVLNHEWNIRHFYTAVAPRLIVPLLTCKVSKTILLSPYSKVVHVHVENKNIKCNNNYKFIYRKL